MAGLSKLRGNGLLSLYLDSILGWSCTDALPLLLATDNLVRRVVAHARTSEQAVCLSILQAFCTDRRGKLFFSEAGGVELCIDFIQSYPDYAYNSAETPVPARQALAVLRNASSHGHTVQTLARHPTAPVLLVGLLRRALPVPAMKTVVAIVHNMAARPVGLRQLVALETGHLLSLVMTDTDDDDLQAHAAVALYNVLSSGVGPDVARSVVSTLFTLSAVQDCVTADAVRDIQTALKFGLVEPPQARAESVPLSGPMHMQYERDEAAAIDPRATLRSHTSLGFRHDGGLR